MNMFPAFMKLQSLGCLPQWTAFRAKKDSGDATRTQKAVSYHGVRGFSLGLWVVVTAHPESSVTVRHEIVTLRAYFQQRPVTLSITPIGKLGASRRSTTTSDKYNNSNFVFVDASHCVSENMDGSSPRKRSRENETISQKVKREKAAERQRRKRERDRATAQSLAPVEPQEVQDVQAFATVAQVQQAVVNAAGLGMLYAPPDQQHLALQHHMAHQLMHAHPIPIPPNINEYQPEPSPSPPPSSQQPQLTKEEHDRREKVRMAARERQRKHRALVKEKKMRDMGVDPNGAGSDVSVSVDDPLRGYAPPEYIPHDLQHAPPLMEPPFPMVAQGLGGQTFASTLLLSFSCAPLLKAHLLRTLNMTNEELASLEPVIAEAWDRWNSQVRSRRYFPERYANSSI